MVSKRFVHQVTGKIIHINYGLADKRNVIVVGQGRGEIASIYLEHDDGFELAEIYLVPEDKRPQR